MRLNTLVNKINKFLRIKDFGLDVQMRLFVPDCYEKLDLDWQSYFESDFVRYLNGLMIKGGEEVNSIYCCSFPSNDVLEKFINIAKYGDMLFTHHALEFNCGDPKGVFGNGWQPLELSKLERIKTKGLSIYSVHGPLDYNKEIGVVTSLMKVMNAKFLEEFHFDGVGYHAAICEIPEVTYEQLSKKILNIFEIPYLDIAGQVTSPIRKIALVAGGGDKASLVKAAIEKKCDAFIAGEFRSRMTTEFGRINDPIMMEVTKDAPMAIWGVSHSASEFIAMKTLVSSWLRTLGDMNIKLIRPDMWWK